MKPEPIALFEGEGCVNGIHPGHLDVVLNISYVKDD